MKAIMIENDDWVVLYVDGNAKFQGHNIPALTLLSLAEKYDFKCSELKISWIQPEDERGVERFGRFPNSMYDLEGNYE